MRLALRALCLVSIVPACSLSVAQEPDGGPMETIEVVGTAPLSLGQDVEGVSSNIQAVTSEEIAAQHTLDFADFIKRNLASVFVNEAQSNPLQPDVQYRGFVGSPLLGLPQGLAVYQDAVRINEPFGDTVNWALIPETAIDTAFLMPGSNPLFGLNSLGGAIAIETKDGFSHPGSSLEVSAGSFARVGVEIETGDSSSDAFAYYATASYLDEDGWRDYSPTQAFQAFGKLSWRRERSSFDLSLTHANTDLIGNGAAPAELLSIDRKAIFTRPDQTENALDQINLVAQRDISENLLLTGNVYARRSDIDSLNGDDSDYEECEDDPGFICLVDARGIAHLAFDESGGLIAASDALIGATVNRTRTEQDSRGFGIQLNWFSMLGEHDNGLIVGFAYDESDVDFGSSTELGTLDATRLAVPGGVVLGDSLVALRTTTSNVGLYASNSFALSEQLSLTLSARYNKTRIELRDGLGTELNGTHEFDRFNPAVGLSYRIAPNLTLFGSYAESNRTPSPVELTCADENAPCRLPNAFLADPPLEQVAASTLELGLRGAVRAFNWHAGWFETANENDILFISAGSLTNEGYFSNVGRTRRAGIELSLDGDIAETIHWFSNYTDLDASFEDSLLVPSINNPFAIDGEIEVSQGDRLPLVPDRMLKFGIDIEISPALTVGADMLHSSGIYLRGDEGNFAARTHSYTVLNARVDYALSERLALFGVVENLLDEDYETFGVFGDATEVLGPAFADRRFLSPAEPRALWLGIQLDFR